VQHLNGGIRRVDALAAGAAGAGPRTPEEAAAFWRQEEFPQPADAGKQ
jgi:hypothetical protein